MMGTYREKSLRDDPDMARLEELLREQSPDRREAFFDWLEDEIDTEEAENGQTTES